MQETWVKSLGLEDPLEWEMATHSSILAWEIPWTEEPGRLHVYGVARSRTWLSAHTHTYLCPRHSAFVFKVGKSGYCIMQHPSLNSLSWSSLCCSGQILVNVVEVELFCRVLYKAFVLLIINPSLLSFFFFLLWTQLWWLQLQKPSCDFESKDQKQSKLLSRYH